MPPASVLPKATWNCGRGFPAPARKPSTPRSITPRPAAPCPSSTTPISRSRPSLNNTAPGHPIPRNRVSAPLGTHNALLSARARVHFVHDFAGPLSIKSVTEGSVAWKSGGRELVVNRDSFLVLNHGEIYSLSIESRMPVATLFVFFQDGFVESVHGSLRCADVDPEPAPAHFLGCLHPRDGRIPPIM